MILQLLDYFCFTRNDSQTFIKYSTFLAIFKELKNTYLIDIPTCTILLLSYLSFTVKTHVGTFKLHNWFMFDYIIE